MNHKTISAIIQIFDIWSMSDFFSLHRTKIVSDNNLVTWISVYFTQMQMKRPHIARTICTCCLEQWFLTFCAERNKISKYCFTMNYLIKALTYKINLSDNWSRKDGYIVWENIETVRSSNQLKSANFEKQWLHQI